MRATTVLSARRPCRPPARTPYGRSRSTARASIVAVALGLVATIAAAAPFPGQGVDMFPSSSPLCVVINGASYGTMAKGMDPATVVSRTDPFIEGTPPDTTGSNLPTGGCPACDPNVNDADIGCWPPLAEMGVHREVHTEMLDLRICHDCGVCTCGPPHSCDTICYLAGQPAFNALAGIGQQARYRNSYGEVESKDPNSIPANDFPALSFFAMKGVITVTPAPAGTSGVFVLADLNDSILMVNDPIGMFPPAAGDSYTIKPGTKLPGGAGGPCSICNIPIADAATGAAVGVLCCPPVHHDIEPCCDFPAFTGWGLAVSVGLVLSVASFLFIRQRHILAP